MSSKTVRALYRLFLRQCRDLERQQLESLSMRMPVNKEAWMTGGQHGWAPPPADFYLQSFQSLAPLAAQGASSGTLTPGELRAAVQRAFRHPPAGASREQALDAAFASLRVLGDQVALQEATSTAVTQGLVHVEVSTAYVGCQADLDPTYEEEEGVQPKHYYTYRVRVSNVGQEVVQLLGRHWVIEDAGGGVVAEVPKGSKGVVGCTPLIKPNECFEYYSGTDLESPGGRMRGSFQMAVVDLAKGAQGPWLRTFDAEVAPFRFVPPGGSDGGSSGSGSNGSGGS